MIKLNNPDHQESKTFSQEELGNIVNVLNIQFKENREALPMLQRLIDDYNHKVYFYEAVGGREGLAKLQEIADRQWISVDERLPEHLQNVIIQYKIMSSKVIGAGNFSTTTETWYVFDIEKEIGKPDVIQWQPMPEPPKSK